jgi:hypothetical protein
MSMKIFPKMFAPPAVALMARIVSLQDTWITTGDDSAYDEWREALEEMTNLIAPYRSPGD